MIILCMIFPALISGQTAKERLQKYANVTLTADISHLTPNETEMLIHLFKAAKIMDDLFWKQSYGDKDDLMNKLKSDEERQFAAINYGPWDRLAGNEPWVNGYGPKPRGANFYPADMTVEEFKELDDPLKTSLYTLIRRDEQENLTVIPYHEKYSDELNEAALHILKAAELSENDDLKIYLEERANALITDMYQGSDFAWMRMKDANIDFIVGAIENYEDALFGYKAAYEAFVLIKDIEWSERLQHFNEYILEMQDLLPVEYEYKRETPGTDADINVYEAIYYAGDCNAGSKAIAVNLPNDEEVQLRVGSRKLQIKNSMQAKFDKILVPISKVVIHPDQQHHVTFDAFFANTMFHEIAHGMGIKNTIRDEPQTVREALRETYSPIEENKADIIGIWLAEQLHERGELEGELMDYYVTFMAGIFRSSRFGSASAHGIANMMRFNYFLRHGAFEIDENGYYITHPENMHEAIRMLVEELLRIQGDGDYEKAAAMIARQGVVPEILQNSLDKINSKNIPVDIVFSQGLEYLDIEIEE